MKQRNLAMFGLVDILVEYTLTMIGFQGLITELEVWKLHRQTLKVNRGQNPFQGHSNKPKYAQRSLAQLRTAFGDEASCKKIIYTYWFAEFKRGRVTTFVMVAHPPP
ncbi:hypothetical protein EVAR_66273_1 [Eumeta japonica]|uniref:Uncharacterized protein n=1 Tax=Eumeta variegata TaxID=151549 RepID=A0A4C1ZV63_EUMVA|nr:hypothetical protein EVAR_66273_1 [Eumeta japonica]